jgi:6-methylsalicylate decarboxylase
VTTEPTPLVDVHAHFLTDRYVAEARAGGHEHPDGMPGWPTWSAAEHLRLMDTWGIGRSVLSISSPGVHFGDDEAARALARHVNDAGAAVVAEHPDRFGQFASLPVPDVEGSRREAARALDELGTDGVTIESNGQGVYLGDERLEPLWADLDRRAAVVFVHPTSPPCAEEISLGRPRPMLEFVFDTTRTVSDLVFSGVLERYPSIRWVFTHGGGTLPLLADRIELFRSAFLGADGTPVPEQLRALWWDMAGTPFPRQVPALVTAFGSDQVLYGSDWCWTPTPATAAQVASVDAADPAPDGRSWRELTTANARRLFGR